MTHVSLCSGIGGIDLAAELAGFRTVGVCEFDAKCQRVLRARFPEARVWGDLRELAGADVIREVGTPTLVSAGFPCQPFSVAGQRGGDDDPRHLWPHVARILCETQPRWFLGENVRGLLSISDGRVFGAILADLAHMGYRVGWGCCGADEAAGATHRRDRVFIVGYLAHGPSDHRGCGERISEAGAWQDGIGGRRSASGGARLAVRAVEDAKHGSRGRCDGDSPGNERPPEAPGSGGELAHGDSEGRGLNRSAELPDDEREACWHDAYRCRPFPFPPGPNECQRWGAVLAVRPDLAPALYGSPWETWSVARALRPFAPGRNKRERRENAATIAAALGAIESSEEEVELEVRELADGVPGGLALSRRDRLKMLGNAVVPAQVLPILEWIASYEANR